MNAFRFLAAMAATVALAGCHGGVETDVMQRELRLQEDQIYHLLDQIDQARAQLETYQEENQKLKAKLARDEGNSVLAPPGDFGAGLPDLEPPKVEQGILTEPGAPSAPDTPPEEPDQPEPDGPGAADELPAEPDVLEPSAGTHGSRTGIDRLVVHPVIRSEAGKQAGTSRKIIRAFVQPRAADGTVIRYPGPISLMLVDASQQPRPARIGRWDFSSAQTRMRWQQSRAGAGAVFELPWPEGELPADSRLELWARIVLPEGRKLLAHADLDFTESPPARPPQAVAQTRSQDGFRARRTAARNRPNGWVRRTEAPPPTQASAGLPGTDRAAEPPPRVPRRRPTWHPERE